MQPPEEEAPVGGWQPAVWVDLRDVDPTIPVRILEPQVQTIEPRCILSQEAASACAAAQAMLLPDGFSLLARAGYRPHAALRHAFITGRAASPQQRAILADPSDPAACGACRGTVVEVVLCAAGSPATLIEMPCEYRQGGEGAAPPSGAPSTDESAATRHCRTLIGAMAAQGFAVDGAAWWRFELREASMRHRIENASHAYLVPAKPGSSGPKAGVLSKGEKPLHAEVSVRFEAEDDGQPPSPEKRGKGAGGSGGAAEEGASGSGAGGTASDDGDSGGGEAAPSEAKVWLSDTIFAEQLGEPSSMKPKASVSAAAWRWLLGDGESLKDNEKRFEFQPKMEMPGTRRQMKRALARQAQRGKACAKLRRLMLVIARLCGGCFGGGAGGVSDPRARSKRQIDDDEESQRPSGSSAVVGRGSVVQISGDRTSDAFMDRV